MRGNEKTWLRHSTIWVFFPFTSLNGPGTIFHFQLFQMPFSGNQTNFKNRQEINERESKVVKKSEEERK